ncbi:MAG: DUF2723 domain-containing protein [Balneolaceae bacterium]
MNLTTIFAQHRTRNIFFALLSFLTSFVIYFLTVAPTASFWDPAEYIAISHTLQVAHPPGSPFFALWGRLFSMFMPPEYVALSINMISVLASACTIMLLYLITVRLIQEWKGPADQMDPMDLAGLYGGALFGALTFAVTHTQWFNAVEAEMYASSTFFTALVVWVALRWAGEHQKPNSERWLILIAYLIGLGIGVHLLNLLAIFFIAMIVYFKKWEYRPHSFLAMAGIAIGIFLLIYPFTIINIPDLFDDISNMTYGLIGPVGYMAFIIGTIIAALWYTHTRKLRLLNLAMLAYAVIIIGYSSYALIFIRSQAEPAIDENDPSTLEAFVSYLKREQYGESPLLMGYTYDNQLQNLNREQETLFPRRHSQSSQHHDYYQQFDSDWDYFWKYQVYHMYVRYFNWNFIGREADVQHTGWYSGFGETPYSHNPANSGYFFLPFLFGLFGMLYHFRNDWKRGLSVLALFIMTGLAIIFYLNQTPMEPRERDYAYAGSFFAFSIWIGIGGTALIELLKQQIGENKAAAYGLLGLMFLAVPFWVAKENWPSHDRSSNYVARDYAYNLLNSVEPNALLFTNGDNDTFPLWYLQEVEGVRTDVRVVCLSLLNTDWYIKQLRDRQTHESLPLPIRMSDEEIASVTRELTIHESGEYVIPVNKTLLRHAFSGESVNLQEISGVTVDERLQYQLESAVPYSIPVDSLDDEVSWDLRGRLAGYDQQGNPRHFLQVQDKLVLEILESNQWIRPVYFANTVSREGQLGLQSYFQLEGKAFRVVPKRRENVGQFGYIDPEFHTERLENFRFEEWNNPNAYFDENIRRMFTNYRYGFTYLADTFIEQGEPDKAAEWLAFGEDRIPFRAEEDNWAIPVLYAYRYAGAGAHDRAVSLAEFSKEQILHWMNWDLGTINELEQQISELEQRSSDAREQANVERARRYAQQAEQVQESLQESLYELRDWVSFLTIIQRIYYLADMEAEGDQLGSEINVMSAGWFRMPENREENREQIESWGLDF